LHHPLPLDLIEIQLATAVTLVCKDKQLHKPDIMQGRLAICCRTNSYGCGGIDGRQ
jgi:hypothetical protein